MENPALAFIPMISTFTFVILALAVSGYATVRNMQLMKSASLSLCDLARAIKQDATGLFTAEYFLGLANNAATAEEFGGLIDDHGLAAALSAFNYKNPNFRLRRPLQKVYMERIRAYRDAPPLTAAPTEADGGV